MKKKKIDWMSFVYILFFVCLIGLIVSIFTSNYNSPNFYKDNCKTLNSTYLENYSLCYRIVNNEITYYNIDKYKDKLYLLKNTQFFGVDKK